MLLGLQLLDDAIDRRDDSIYLCYYKGKTSGVAAVFAGVGVAGLGASLTSGAAFVCWVVRVEGCRDDGVLRDTARIREADPTSADWPPDAVNRDYSTDVLEGKEKKSRCEEQHFIATQARLYQRVRCF